jgi:hypothetical protein
LLYSKKSSPVFVCFSPFLFVSTMASLAAVDLKEPIIPMVSSFNYDEVRTVKISHSWNDGTNDVTFKMELPVCTSVEHKELILYVIDAFVDGRHATKLNLENVALYQKFPMVLGGDLRIQWTSIASARATANDQTTLHWVEDVESLIAYYFPESSALDQKEYMRAYTKPFNVSVESLGSRVRIVSRLGRWLPGSENRHLFPTNDELKRIFYMMMPESWRVKFVESGTVLDGTYAFNSLIRFMAVQASLANKRSRRDKRKNPPNNPAGRGRGFGRGGRGGGGRFGSYGGGRYGSFGRGRGRGNQGQYHYHGGGYQTNPYLTPRPGGGPARGSPGGRGRFGSHGGRFVSPGSGRGYNLQPSYARGNNRPPLPSVPNFYTDQHDQFFSDPYCQDAAGHYDYSSVPPNIPDGYFTHLEQVPSHEEQYYHGHSHDQRGHPDGPDDEQKESAEDTHWLEY